MIDTTIADPAPTCPASPLIAVPMAAKIPAPTMAPMPSAVSCSGPSERRRPPPASPSAMHWSTVLRRNSCVALDKQRRSEEHTSELQSLAYLVCRLLLEKKKKKKYCTHPRVGGPANNT